MYIDYHEPIRFTIYPAATFAGLSPKGASAFAAWLAELCTGLPTGFADEDAISKCMPRSEKPLATTQMLPNEVTRDAYWTELGPKVPTERFRLWRRREEAAAFRKSNRF
jgi:hypothetical protein